MSTQTRGAGLGGGLLFLGVMLFVGYLAVTAIAGVLKWLLGTAILVVAILLLVNLFRRR